MDYKELVHFFQHLDRAAFIDTDSRDLAAIDAPLPIGYGQTISQPSLVLEMTWQLRPESHNRVLEIGTGSGFQTALLAAFADQVYTVERIPELYERASRRLAAMGYGNVACRLGDGSDGWPEEAPFDRIMVTAAAERLPQALVDQLAPGGRMIVPVGPRTCQELLLVTRSADGPVAVQAIESVIFVELHGKYGWTHHD